MYTLLCEYHDVFALEVGEHGETVLIQLKIDTGNAPPNRQHPCRMPFSAREEVAKQLKKMQEMSVIQPLKLPWSSPVVLVCKKDVKTSHLFICYCKVQVHHFIGTRQYYKIGHSYMFSESCDHS